MILQQPEQSLPIPAGTGAYAGGQDPEIHTRERMKQPVSFASLNDAGHGAKSVMDLDAYSEAHKGSGLWRDTVEVKRAEDLSRYPSNPGEATAYGHLVQDTTYRGGMALHIEAAHNADTDHDIDAASCWVNRVWAALPNNILNAHNSNLLSKISGILEYDKMSEGQRKGIEPVIIRRAIGDPYTVEEIIKGFQESVKCAEKFLHPDSYMWIRARGGRRR